MGLIARLRGTLAEKTPSGLVVECGGVGYGVTVPLSTFDRLPAEGEEVTLRIFHLVREDDALLFGFGSAQELRFFHFVKRQHRSRRGDFHMAGRLRMRHSDGDYVNVLHRIFYITEPTRNALRLALCLYTPLACDIPDAGMIIDAAEGTVIDFDTSAEQRILSPREKQILRLIDNGLPSKEIAQRLSISIHTVSRHRQQILGKLRVKNSIEACRTAKSLHLI